MGRRLTFLLTGRKDCVRINKRFVIDIYDVYREVVMKVSRLETNYEAVGLKKEVLPFEDGLRTEAKTGSYEWWYFDTKLQGGGSLVIIYFTKPITSFKGKFEPYVLFDLTLPSGKGEIHKAFYPDGKGYSFSKDGCDVRIGECTCKGDLKTYELYCKDGETEAKVTIQGNVPSWRPYAGQIRFGKKDYFAWLPSIPEGNMQATITHQGETRTFTGTGYHDHNWGNKLMFFLMHHWYWGRARIGDYTVVSSYITSNKQYSYAETPVFMVAKNGEILADDGLNCLKYEEKDYVFDETTQKHIAKTLVYDYEDGDKRYLITYKMDESVEKKDMKAELKTWQYPIVWAIGLRGAYHRVAGQATLEYYEKGELKERCEAPAMWEQMYFGKDRLR